MNTHGSITAALRTVQQAGEKIDLLNLYKGVPIVYPAAIHKLNVERVVLHIASHEIVCLTLERTTILLNHILEEAVSAEVVELDLAAGDVTLGNLRYASEKVGDRMVLRVRPRETVDVRLDCGGQTFNGLLADLSINGLGINFSLTSPLTAQSPIRPRAVVQASLTLPGGEALRLAGTVRFIRMESGFNRVGVEFAQGAQMLIVLHYVHERQQEILGELRAAYENRLNFR
ncbi:MAG: PilZ domain-containing protein [Anaerolineales bacterium]